MTKVPTRKVLALKKLWSGVVLTARRRHLGIENIAPDSVVRLGLGRSNV